MFKLRQLANKVHIEAPSEAAVEYIHNRQYDSQLHGDFMHVNQ